MNRLLVLSGLPTLHHLMLAFFALFERLLTFGGAVPVAAGTLVAYLFLIARSGPVRG